MAIAQFIEGTAFGVFNDILSAFHNNEGYALPNRYEVVIIPPAKIGRKCCIAWANINHFNGLKCLWP